MSLQGIIPRSCEEIFNKCHYINDNDDTIEEITVKCSFIEIYKEVPPAPSAVSVLFNWIPRIVCDGHSPCVSCLLDIVLL